MTATTEAPAWTCKCGCERPLKTRGGGGYGYAEACLKRWRRLGCPEGGPPPAWGAHRSVRDGRLDELEALFARGFSYAQAAAELGLTVRSIENYAKALNERKRARAAALAETLRPASPLPAAVCWQDRAACRGQYGLFFGPEGERLADRQARETAAQSLCEFCPVRPECLDEGLGHKYGTWGGLTEDDRTAAKRDQRRGAVA